MWIMSSKKNALVDAASLFISPKRDKDDNTKILGWRLMATLNTGRSIPVAVYATEKIAEEALFSLAKNAQYIQVVC